MLTPLLAVAAYRDRYDITDPDPDHALGPEPTTLTQRADRDRAGKLVRDIHQPEPYDPAQDPLQSLDRHDHHPGRGRDDGISM